MRRINSGAALTLALLVGLLAGCGDFNGNMPVGGVVSEEWTASQLAAAEDNEPGPDEQDGHHAADHANPQPDEKTGPRPRRGKRPLFPRQPDRPNAGRQRPRDAMPGDTERWGRDRRMPSDSMPSETESWGEDRARPSDSMPSQTEKWGKDRPMPSDSMPSRSPLRPPLPSETQDP